MDVKPIQWGEHRESQVRMDPHGQPMVELISHDDDAPCGVLHWPDVCMTRLTKTQALALGRALVRMAR